MQNDFLAFMTGNSRLVILPQEMIKILIFCFSPGLLFYLPTSLLCVHYLLLLFQWELLKERILKALCLPSSPTIFECGALF